MAWQSVAAPPAAAAPQYAHSASKGGTSSPPPPINTVLPSIPASPIYGSTISVTNGTWTGSGITYAYQWYKQGVLLAGETAQTYAIPGSTTEVGNNLLALVKATNSVATSYALSNGATVTADPNADPYFANVTVLMHFNGTNGATTTTDVKGNTVTRKGTATISSSQSKFGGTSTTTASSSGWAVTGGAGLQMGTGNFTVEGWIFPTATVSGSSFDFLNTYGAGNSTSGFYMQIEAGGVLRGGILSGSTALTLASGSGAVVANVWQHVALSRVGAAGYLFVNGTLVASSATLFGTSAMNTVSTQLGIGAENAATVAGMPGYMDDVRITKGVGRYTTSFTPPAIQFPDA